MTLEELKVVISAETKGLEKAVKGVKSTLNGLTKQVSAATKRMSASFDKLGKSVNKSFAGLLKSAGLLLGIAGLIKLGKQALETASDLEEIQNVVNVVFGSSAKQIDQWAKGALKQFGLVESEAKDIVSTFKAMANGMSIADKSGTAMSIKLTELAADLASFRNVSTDVAATALKGVFTGETEALKKFGVVMTQANLDAFALSKGITKSYNAMSQAEKVALRYQYVMQATADAQGDFARSASSWANQIRVLKGQWSSFLGVLGTAIKQVLAPLLKVLNNILASVITLAKNLFALFGVDFSTSVASVSSSLGAGADGAEGISDGLDDATGSAKKLNKEIAKFDELETIGDKVSGGGGLGDLFDDASSDLEIDLPEVNMDENDSPLFKSFREALEKLEDWFENKLDPMLRKAGQKFADLINQFFGDSEIWHQAGETIGAGLNAIIHMLDEFWTRLDGVQMGKSLAEFFNGWVEKWDASATGHMISEKIKTVLDIANAFLETFKFKDLGEKIAKMFDEWDWHGIGERLGKLISNVLLAAMDFAIGLTTGKWGQYASDFIDGFAEGWKGEELKEKFLNEFKPAMLEAWQELWGSLEENSVIGDLIKAIERLTEQITILVGIVAGLKIFAEIFTILNTGVPILTTVADALFHTKGWCEAAAVAANGMVSPIGFLKNIMYQLSVALTDANGAFLGISTSMKTSLATLGAWAAAIAAIIAALIGAYHHNEQFRQSVQNFIAEVKEGVADILDHLREMYEQHLKPLVEETVDLIKTLWNDLKAIWAVFSNWLGSLLALLMPVVSAVWNMLKSLVNNIIQIVNGLLDVFRGVITFLNGVFKGDWAKAWQGIVLIFQGIFEGLGGFFKGVLNVLIGALNTGLQAIGAVANNVIRILNKLKVSVPSWVPEIGGRTFGFNISPVSIPSIPYLAKGGIIENPTMAMLGEYPGAQQNPEIATPEKLLREIIVNANGEVVTAFYQIAQQIITAINDVDMSVEIGDETIAQSVRRGAQQYYKQTGYPLLQYT